MAGTSNAALFDLSGRVAVVTGGSRGLGREMVLAFARAGADVVIASRKLDNCEALAAEVRDTTGQQALAVECHVGYWDQNDALCERVYDEFGHCEVLVNNAGLSPLYPSLYEVSEGLFDKVIDVNLKGPFRASAVFGKRMYGAGGGSIINVSSVAAVAPSPNETAYGAAKAGIHAITQSFAREYAPRVRVNCIMPGPFLTDISKAWDMEAFNERATNEIALGRGGEADEVVGAALYFASEASSYTTGSVLKIDGGTAWQTG
ncbi:SDR family NAD(P)-dependent oxidoreductase [Candidatus Poriferisodalis sp.]|uniref:SDR family NAD(P)-dependent oxidoreductase n=1 Tax=Candidatus Poriferisodalis sp. TaxID=3101277 RepID=UPI003B0105E5